VIKNISNMDLPFGGERQSGFGRYHGSEGLRSMSRIKTGGWLDREVNWFPQTATAFEGLRMLVRLLYGDGGVGGSARQLVEGLRRMLR
jgi:hypothetical protein